MTAAKDSTRAEEFKRATAGAVRALAQSSEVQVAFQPGPAGLAGKRARLPVPSAAVDIEGGRYPAIDTLRVDLAVELENRGKPLSPAGEQSAPAG